ncbi:MAG: sugar nucleotide-binding protein [archaeon]
MERVLIVGADGYVGARLYADLKKSFDVAGTYFENRLFPELLKLDITNATEAIEIVERTKPTIIVHVAANPSVAWCEANPALAKKINADGTSNVVKAANRANAKVIYISSFAAIRPNTVYGKTKRAGEEFVKNAKAGFIILRPSLILGFSPNTANDRPFNRLLKNITDKTPAVYDRAWKFQPTWIGHVSEIIQKVIEKRISGEIIPIAVPGLKSRFDIAKDILPSFGIEVASKDAKDDSQVVEETQDKLKQLGLAQYTYREIIEKIKKEITEHLERGGK